MSTVITHRAGDIARITLNRPDALNAFSPELLDDLTAAFEDCAEDPPAAVILSGAGRAFSAGVDLKILQTAAPEHGRLAGVYEGRDEAVIAALRAVPCPVIGQVHGACFTGALEMALHCDFIFTTEDTKFGDTHAKFAIRPSWGMSQNLPLAVGLRRAKELSYTARTFTGAEAAEWGLANAALPDQDALEAHAAETASRIAANDAATVRAYKDLHRMHEEKLIADALEEEIRRDYPEITGTEERLKGFGS
ncbi:MAG: enoyl-CoA hydratase/isomerase family protein [Euryhalocaulis sp.]|uniref:enoyl-CoA hydratase/isomerase family protein n=1 Tax=Euryhalocaulis sp. TaxID=2744307 RepID=UPI0017CCA715|nr:enoyl-CoA hydratase/isomerase family protein [Euryhalocaulis sp.]MBA4802634.1 enoyl-CoA hydratase/isomerase family protein [Euryhalocaulis sp.]